MNNLDADALIKAGRKVREPFCLMLDASESAALESLTIRKVFRLLPGKRIVALATLGDRELLVKVFIGRFAARYARRERLGAQAVAGSGVPTPGYRWQRALKSGGGQVIAFDYLEGARNLTEAWQQAADDDSRLALTLSVLTVLARLHAAGVVQNDIHPENFLIHDGQIHTIDGGDVSNRRRPLTETESLSNLALYFAQFLARYDEQLPTALRFYEKQRGWSADSDRLGRLVESVTECREQRKLDHIDKAFRECTRFCCQKSFKRFSVCERSMDSDDMRAFLADLDSAIENGQLLKDGNTATVALVDSPVGRIVVKRYNIKNVLHRLSRLFRKSRAWVSWANSHRLEFLGIKTVRPIALVEERLGPLRSRAYFVSEYVEGPDASMLDAERDDQMQSIAEIIQNLSRAGVTHGDLKASNFLLSDDGAVIIDLDSMTEHVDGRQRSRAEKKDRERFMKNWESNPSIERRFTDLLG